MGTRLFRISITLSRATTQKVNRAMSRKKTSKLLTGARTPARDSDRMMVQLGTKKRWRKKSSQWAAM